DPRKQSQLSEAITAIVAKGWLEKAKNGADILDKQAFVKNLGLTAGSALPVGVPIPWPLKDAPTGWIKCNGSAFTAAQ
ncbi:hypothetical protein AFK69_18285, partial [Xenorhabdus sp. GDc328]|uniref:phage tail protein n=1 Tax=Xenorhabdus sp. GDc328 TaxID=742178 RepID=UPI0006C72220